MFAETLSLVTIMMISDIFNSQGNGGWGNEQGPPALDGPRGRWGGVRSNELGARARS